MSASGKPISLDARHPYKVFISSTYIDNEERRRIVRDAITMAEMVWHGMEIFTASTQPTVEVCLCLAIRLGAGRHKVDHRNGIWGRT